MAEHHFMMPEKERHYLDLASPLQGLQETTSGIKTVPKPTLVN